MVETTVWLQFQKADGIVAVIAFRDCRLMEFGLADGCYAVVATAAISKDFPMIDERDNIKSQWRMTGRTGIAGRDMDRLLDRDTGKVFVMADLAVRRQPFMKIAGFG